MLSHEKSLVLLTGGGTAGHVTPNLAIAERLAALGYSIEYAGSAQGIEREIVERAGIKFHSVASGKLRRYFSWQNFVDAFKVVQGVFQGFFLVRKLRPALIFSKGGFVAFPIVAGGWLNRVPVVIHESDLSPGLATKLSSPFASRICTTFSDTRALLKLASRVEETGTPIRSELMQGSRERGLKFCGFDGSKKVLMVMGGSQGASAINSALRAQLPRLQERFDVVHLCGRGKLDESLRNCKGYTQIEYLHSEIADVFACADLVLSRAGSNSIFELLALRKKNVLIPLSRKASRGDQIQNARYFERMGYSKVILEEDLTEQLLIDTLFECDDTEFPALATADANGTGRIVKVLQDQIAR
jgi:UDP-N-acetylglucosamine--N-acetylmuramyl-(pentapeptide) pyrophosphoryl-undecaprenol N-acetylglucosamine transferase